MSKEYLEAFESIMKIYGNTNSLEGTYNYFLIIKKALQRLEAIENSNPSEALECLEKARKVLTKMFGKEVLDEEGINLDTIKQSLIKAQEPKHYLKWEDLKLFEEHKDYFALLNGNKYTLWCYSDSKNKYVMISLNGIVMSTLCDMFKQEVDFFNDLHLEVLE